MKFQIFFVIKYNINNSLLTKQIVKQVKSLMLLPT